VLLHLLDDVSSEERPGQGGRFSESGPANSGPLSALSTSQLAPAMALRRLVLEMNGYYLVTGGLGQSRHRQNGERK
jgi:hypothetical protein